MTININGDKSLAYMNIRQRLIYIFTGIFFGGLYLYLSFLVDSDIFRTLDYESLVNVQNSISRKLDLPFSVFTLLGSSEVTLAVTAAIFIYILFKKKHIFLGLFFYFSIFVVELIGKLLIYHPSPPIVLNRNVLDFHLPSSFIVHTSFSYPSGHMARISFVSVILLFITFLIIKSVYKKIIVSLIIFSFIGIIFISRIYLGEHWLSDVIGGLTLGATVAALAISFW